MIAAFRELSGVPLAVVAAVLFGASTPISKVLLGQVDPVWLAGLLYLGSGCGLTLWWFIRRQSPTGRSMEAGLKSSDLPWLGGAVLSGGVAGPVLLLTGLKATSASSVALLLNLEGVFTAILAWFVFKENFDRRIMMGMAAITAGCVILSWSGQGPLYISWGASAVTLACVAWAIDNNLTRKISAGDPVQIAALKGLFAGAANMAIALEIGEKIPDALNIAFAAVVGLFGYGVSLICYVLSLRYLGTARTGAYFALAPFVGAALSFALLGEQITSYFLAGAALMGIGFWLHLTELHDHGHWHRAREHEHAHIHDVHHRHAHDEPNVEDRSHSHRHKHGEIFHHHPHYPDIHHRHDH